MSDSSRFAEIGAVRALSRISSLMSTTRNICDLPIMPISEITVDPALHLSPGSVAMREVRHEGGSDGAEGALLLALLS